MCQQPKLNYPKANAKLVNGHYIDLLFEYGAIQLTHRDYDQENRNSYTKRYTLNKDQKDPITRKRKSNYIQTPSPINKDKKGSVDAATNTQVSRDVDNGNLPNICQSLDYYWDRIAHKHKQVCITKPKSDSIGAPNQVVSRDVMDGNIPNYRQTPSGTLLRSPFGYPQCNYCGTPSHKREYCPYKLADRSKGLTRIDHPNKEKIFYLEHSTHTKNPHLDI